MGSNRCHMCHQNQGHSDSCPVLLAHIKAEADEGAASEAYEAGRRDALADVAAWLREPGPSIWCNVHMRLADEIERGDVPRGGR